MVETNVGFDSEWSEPLDHKAWAKRKKLSTCKKKRKQMPWRQSKITLVSVVCGGSYKFTVQNPFRCWRRWSKRATDASADMRAEAPDILPILWQGYLMDWSTSWEDLDIIFRSREKTATLPFRKEAHRKEASTQTSCLAFWSFKCLPLLSPPSIRKFKL